MKTELSYDAFSLLFISLLLVSSIAFSLPNAAYAVTPTMTFTTGETIDFSSNTEMSFWSNVSMIFGTNITIQFLDNDGILMPSDILHIIWPLGYIPRPSSWWEVLDPQGRPIGEFHVDASTPTDFHIDQVIPGPIPVPAGLPVTAVKKIDIIQPSDYYVVHWPIGWYPLPSSWWEILDPDTRQPTGYEFHVDWTNLIIAFRSPLPSERTLKQWKF